MIYIQESLWSSLTAGFIGNTIEQPVSLLSTKQVRDISAGPDDIFIGFNSYNTSNIHYLLKEDTDPGYSYLFTHVMPTLKENWVVKVLLTKDSKEDTNAKRKYLFLSVLYSIFKDSSYKYIRDTYLDTLNGLDRSISGVLIPQRMTELVTDLSELALESPSNIIVTRHKQGYVATMEVLTSYDNKTLVEVFYRPGSHRGYITAYNKKGDYEKIRNIFKEEKIYENAGVLYIMFPEGISDLSVDSIKNLIKD